MKMLFGILSNGGIPNRLDFTSENNIKDYLYSVFDSTILRDVVERLGLKDINLFNFAISNRHNRKRIFGI